MIYDLARLGFWASLLLLAAMLIGDGISWWWRRGEHSPTEHEPPSSLRLVPELYDWTAEPDAWARNEPDPSGKPGPCAADQAALTPPVRSRD